jgi:hypothetical protein
MIAAARPAIGLVAPRAGVLTQLGVAVLLAAALQAWDALEASLMFGTVKAELLFHPSAALQNLSLALCLVPAVHRADEHVDRGAARWPAYAAAVLVGCGAGALLQYLLHRSLDLPDWEVAAPRPVHPLQALRVMLADLLWATVLVAPYAGWRARRRARQRVAAVQLRRLVLQGDAARLRSELLQARLDLPWLLAALARVRQVAARDTGQGMRLIDALAACLRSALPPRRGGAPVTLQREVELATAWLALARDSAAACGGPPPLALSASGPALKAVVPAPLVLPLVDQLFDARAGTVALAATLDGAMLTIELSGPAADGPADTGTVAGWSARLQALAAPGASIAIEARPDHRREVRLQLPQPNA